jgi:hypothetical protein
VQGEGAHSRRRFSARAGRGMNTSGADETAVVSEKLGLFASSTKEDRTLPAVRLGAALATSSVTWRGSRRSRPGPERLGRTDAPPG